MTQITRIRLYAKGGKGGDIIPKYPVVISMWKGIGIDHDKATSYIKEYKHNGVECRIIIDAPPALATILQEIINPIIEQYINT